MHEKNSNAWWNVKFYFYKYGKDNLPFAQCWGNGLGRLCPSDLWGCCRWAWGGTNPCELTSSCRRSRTRRSLEFLACHLYLPPYGKVHKCFHLVILSQSYFYCRNTFFNTDGQGPPTNCAFCCWMNKNTDSSNLIDFWHKIYIMLF